MKAKHILLVVLISAVTGVGSAYLYGKYNNRSVSYSQSQVPVNYAGLFDSGAGAPARLILKVRQAALCRL